MKKLTIQILVLAALIIVFVPGVKATHTSAFEFYYRWKADSTYEFTLIFYRHCTGFTASSPSSISLNIHSDSLNYSFTSTLSKMPVIGASVPPLEPVNTYNCSPNPNLCVEEYVYRGDVTFLKRAPDWEITEQVCCRPVEVDNITGAAMIALCGLNNLDFQDSIHQNISPIWHTRRPNIPGHLNDTIVNYPVWNVCEYQDYEIDQSTLEYDGDSISYSLIHYISDNFNVPPFSYLIPYSDSNLLPTDSAKPLSIDPVTGVVSYSPVQPVNPTSLGNIRMFQIAIKATEYRYDSFLVGQNMVWEARPMGFLIRNIQVITTDSSLCPKAVSPFGDTLLNYPQVELGCTDSLISLSLRFNVLCSSIDTNASCFQLIDATTLDTLSLKAAWMDFCFRTGEGYHMKIQPDSQLGKGPYFLMFKQGDDTNTAVSTCGSEITPYYDTLLIVIDTTPVGNLRGDFISNGLYDNKITIDCGDSLIAVNLSEKILCSSVAYDGSEFLLIDWSKSPPYTVPISRAVPVNCTFGTTKNILVSTSVTLEPGNYTFYTRMGSDSNIFLNSCHDEWSADHILLTVKKVSLDLGPDKYFCENDVIVVSLNIGTDLDFYYTDGMKSGAYVTFMGEGAHWITGGLWDWRTRLPIPGCTDTDTIRFIRRNCVGIDEIHRSDFTLRPNPVSDMLYSEHPLLNQVNLKIYDVFGKQVMSSDRWLLEDPVDLSELINGMYVVVLSDGLKSQHLRIIKNQ